MKENYKAYQSQLQKVADIEAAIAVLSWDQEVNMPPKGAHYRARQVATLSGIAHELATDQGFAKNLEHLAAHKDQLEASEAMNVQRSFSEYERQRKLNKDFVMRRAQAISKTYNTWLKAREANDYSVYVNALSDMVAIKREEAELIGYKEHPYDALLDEYEPGSTTAALDCLFAGVKADLVEFVRKIRAKASPDDSFLTGNFPVDKQWQLGLDLLENMGYDFQAGRQDKSPHPFTINFSAQDVRVTTRVDADSFNTMLWSCLHEGGHALYEQGLPADAYGLPLGKFISLGIHESQSRLWENHVGRSLPYWKAHYPTLQQLFPEQFGSVSLWDFYRGINKVNPGLIRVEADEIHYHFHILIRFEIEKALVAGEIEVADLDKHWNAAYKEYLDVDVPDDRQGVLQDIHWAHGSLGYFPTYSLGSFYAAQFYQQARKDVVNLEENIAKGDSSSLLQWLRNHIHQHGRYYMAEELCERVTGEKLQFKYFQKYLQEKFGEIYEL